MASASNDARNYFILDRLLARSHVILRQLFKKRYLQCNSGKVWDDTPVCGRSYFIAIRDNSKINLTEMQKASILNGDSNKWDLTTLATLLINGDQPKQLNKTQKWRLHQELKLVKQLKNIRNGLAHHASKSIVDVEFNKLWTKLRSILVALGDLETELDKLKNDNVFESSTQPVNEENVKEASRLNSLGTQAHKDGKFSDAISLFIQATSLPNVSDHDRAIFFSNMSSTRLALYEQGSNSSNMFEIDSPSDQRYCALQDAKQARNLRVTWWKGHLRVGKVYAALDEHEKAINSFEQALSLDLANNEILKALDESRQIHDRQLKQKHLDIKLTKRTTSEQLSELQQKLGVDPRNVPMGDDLIGGIDLSEDDVVKGHKYAHGDGDIKQDYEQAAKYFAKAASRGNTEGMYHLARLTDRGLGVKKDHTAALKLYEQAAEKAPQRFIFKSVRNIGVAEAQHSLGVRYAEGISVDKNLSTAAYWYERAMKHGSAESANNLALMYLNSTDVDRNVEKAEQLLQFAARSGNSNAMLTLAKLLLHYYNFEMAKMWSDRACEAGNIVAQRNRDTFDKMIAKQQQFIHHSSSCVLQMVHEMKSIANSFQTRKTTSALSNYLYLFDYNMLNEYAARGSKMAQKLCDALVHFAQAFNILMQSEILTKKEENTFVHELSQCFRTAHIVAQIPGVAIRQKIDAIVDRVLQDCSTGSNTVTSQLDEDTRICYATLQMDSRELIIQFLDECKQKYPKTLYFFELSASVNGFSERYEVSLYNANAGLTIDPNYYELLYSKAAALRLIGKDMDEAIETYQTFLEVAPKDHRRVPESYYAMASCYLKRHGLIDFVKKTYKQGEEAEKVQLSCFLPCVSSSKTLLKPVLYPESALNAGSIPSTNRKSHLTDPYRIEVITQHRDWESQAFQARIDPNCTFIQNTDEPHVKQRTAELLSSLKPITLREMNPRKDHTYNGYVLSVTIIEEAYSWAPSIHLVIEDEHLDCERMFIYNFPEGQEEYFTSKVFTIGSKMHIINPYLRLGANDMKSLIRIDDFSSIIMQSESGWVMNMCRCCGEANALHVCTKCKQARYCTIECQTIDWEIYKHELICKNP